MCVLVSSLEMGNPVRYDLIQILNDFIQNFHLEKLTGLSTLHKRNYFNLRRKNGVGYI